MEILDDGTLIDAQLEGLADFRLERGVILQGLPARQLFLDDELGVEGDLHLAVRQMGLGPDRSFVGIHATLG